MTSRQKVGWAITLAILATIIIIALINRNNHYVPKEGYYPGQAMYSYPSYLPYGNLSPGPGLTAPLEF